MFILISEHNGINSMCHRNAWTCLKMANLKYTVKISSLTLDFLILPDSMGLNPTWTALSYWYKTHEHLWDIYTRQLYIFKVSPVMLFTILSNLNHINLHASDEICIFNSWASSQQLSIISSVYNSPEPKEESSNPCNSARRIHRADQTTGGHRWRCFSTYTWH